MTATAEQLPTMLLAPPRFMNDKGQDGWEPIEDTPLTLADGLTLTLSGYLEGGEPYVLGREMLERGRANAEELGPLAGQQLGELLLYWQDAIPSEWQRDLLILAGTIWQDREGTKYVPCIGYSGIRGNPRWKMMFRPLGNSRWREGARFVHVSLPEALAPAA